MSVCSWPLKTLTWCDSVPFGPRQPAHPGSCGHLLQSHLTLPITSFILPAMGAPKINSQLSLRNCINPHFFGGFYTQEICICTSSTGSFALLQKDFSVFFKAFLSGQLLLCFVFLRGELLCERRHNSNVKARQSGVWWLRGELLFLQLQHCDSLFFLFFYCSDFSLAGFMPPFCAGVYCLMPRMGAKLIQAGARCALLPTHLCRFVAFSQVISSLVQLMSTCSNSFN